MVREKIEILNGMIIKALIGKVTCEQRFEEEGVSCVHIPWAEGTAYAKALR